MLKVDRILAISASAFMPLKKLDLRILGMCDTLVRDPISWVDYKELPYKNGKRRFLIRKVYTVYDK
jgi:hypothetical protein